MSISYKKKSAKTYIYEKIIPTGIIIISIPLFYWHMTAPTGGQDSDQLFIQECVVWTLAVVFLFILLRNLHKQQVILEEDKKRFEDIAKSSSDWIWETDAQGKYIYISLGVENILGYTCKEMLDKTPFDLMPPEEAKRVFKIFAGISRNKAPIIDLENCNIAKNGEKVYLITNGVPILSSKGELLGYRGVDKDMTERKHAEKILKTALAAANASSIAKSEFLATMSHEIRTPLNGIIGFSEIIEDTVSKCPDTEYRDKILKYLDIVKTCGKNVTELINDILELSSIESGKNTMQLNEYSPEQLIKESIEIFNFKSEARNIKLDFQSRNLPCLVIVAKRQFKQIMFNLIGNAMKFTEEGSVSVKANYKDEFLLIAVKDTGIGIPDNMKKKILNPFTQVDQSSTRKYGGTGLGLAIVSKILENVGGSLNIKSKIGKGTTFSFTFPVKVNTDAIVLPEDLAEEQAATITANILVVEDDNISALYLKEILQTSNAHYKIAESFVEMQKICNEGFLPDIALLDISLPDADGFECKKWLTDKFPEKNIKYIVETVYVQNEDIKRYEDAGFDGFLGKPYSKKELLEIIKKNIKSS